MKRTTTVFKLWGTPVNVQTVFYGNVLLLWIIVTLLGRYLDPERPVWMDVLIGFAAMLLLMFADLGHAMAHILSARYAGAPMDEVLISAGMPRTLYDENDVPPAAHRMRALGGPIFSIAGCLLSSLVYFASGSGSLVRELSGWSLLGHTLILIGSLAPLPIVDGGSILKWTLVERGQTPSQADDTIRRIDLVLGILAAISGAALLLMRFWIAGLLVIGGAGIVFGIAWGKIK